MTNAAKVLRQGCEKLIALVDSGDLAVSAAARLAMLAHEKQEKALAERAQQLADRPRRGRFLTGSAPVYRPCPSAFGVLGKDRDKDRMLLWVETRALSFAVKALNRRGLRRALLIRPKIVAEQSGLRLALEIAGMLADVEESATQYWKRPCLASRKQPGPR